VADETLIRRYLLGQASDTEEQELEDRYVDDDNYFEHLETIEEELIDAYVAGDLSGDERRHFEQHFLSSTQRCERVAFARALAAKASETRASIAPPVPAAEQQSWWRTWQKFWRMRQPLEQALAFAALAVLVLVGSWSVLQNYQLRRQLTGLRAEQTALQSESQDLLKLVEDQRTLHQQLNDSLEQERTTRSKLEQSLQRAQRPTAIASFILMPGTVRGEEQRTLLIRSNTDAVQFQLDLENEAENNVQYRVAVRTAENQEVWSQDGLRPRRTAAGRAIILNLPANLLPPGNYVILVRMVTSRGDIDDAGQYSFRTMSR